jgi:hypothetical protein
VNKEYKTYRKHYYWLILRYISIIRCEELTKYVQAYDRIFLSAIQDWNVDRPSEGISNAKHLIRLSIQTKLSQRVTDFFS